MQNSPKANEEPLFPFGHRRPLPENERIVHPDVPQSPLIRNGVDVQSGVAMFRRMPVGGTAYMRPVECPDVPDGA